MTDHVLTPVDIQQPVAFTQAQLGWQPWLEPVKEADLTERHYDGLVERARAKNAYFLLLAHDPDILGSRTRTDKDIFYNPDAGLPRAERELSATATSRYNGCIFVPLCMRVLRRFTQKKMLKSSSCWTRASMSIWANAGMHWWTSVLP